VPAVATRVEKSPNGASRCGDLTVEIERRRGIKSASFAPSMRIYPAPIA
jgi:hypothetical protein